MVAILVLLCVELLVSVHVNNNNPNLGIKNAININDSKNIWIVKPGEGRGEVVFFCPGTCRSFVDRGGNLGIEGKQGMQVYSKPSAFQEIEGKYVPVRLDIIATREDKGKFKLIFGTYNPNYPVSIRWRERVDAFKWKAVGATRQKGLKSSLNRDIIIKDQTGKKVIECL